MSSKYRRTLHVPRTRESREATAYLAVVLGVGDILRAASRSQGEGVLWRKGQAVRIADMVAGGRGWREDAGGGHVGVVVVAACS